MSLEEARRQAIRKKYRDKVKSGEWKYNDKHDAYYEAKTLAWVEEKCSDKECEFCVGRPAKAPKSARPRARRT